MKINELLLGVSIMETGAQIGHIYQHMQQGPYIIMSAWRYGLSRGNKRARNRDLKQQIFADFGLAAIKQKGFWPTETDQQGNITSTGNEDSLFIPMNQPTSRIKNIDEFMHLANQLMIKYDQDSVVVNDGSKNQMIFNPNRESQPDPERLGSDMHILGRNKPIPPDQQGWSEKGGYKYYFADRKK